MTLNQRSQDDNIVDRGEEGLVAAPFFVVNVFTDDPPVSIPEFILAQDLVCVC